MNFLTKALIILGLVWPITVNAGVAGKAAGRAASKRAAVGAAVKKEVTPRQKLGPLHALKKPTTVERYTNRPATDQARGLGGKRKEVFARRIGSGRRGTAEHIRKELNIPHPVKQREEIRLPSGTKYHESPVKRGEARRRQMAIHGRIPKENIHLKERLSHAKK